jgi:hypothetical protein
MILPMYLIDMHVRCVKLAAQRPSGVKFATGGPAASGVKLAAGRPSGWRREVNGRAAQLWRPKILMLQKFFLNNKTAFNEVLKTFLII